MTRKVGDMSPEKRAEYSRERAVETAARTAERCRRMAEKVATGNDPCGIYAEMLAEMDARTTVF